MEPRIEINLVYFSSRFNARFVVDSDPRSHEQQPLETTALSVSLLYRETFTHNPRRWYCPCYVARNSSTVIRDLVPRVDQLLARKVKPLSYWNTHERRASDTSRS